MAFHCQERPLIDRAAIIIYIYSNRWKCQRERNKGVSSIPGSQRLPDAMGETDLELREPKWYRVILHNDDYTTMDFVIEILVSVFHKPAAEATRIMLDVHRRKKGVCGTYTYDIASSKVAQVYSLARQREFPLKCSLEEA